MDIIYVGVSENLLTLHSLEKICDFLLRSQVGRFFWGLVVFIEKWDQRSLKSNGGFVFGRCIK